MCFLLRRDLSDGDNHGVENADCSVVVTEIMEPQERCGDVSVIVFSIYREK
jgi:hypothetical protein